MEHYEKSDKLLEIGKRIRDQRQKLHMTQEEFEEKAELGSKYSYVLENGNKSMQLGTFIKICDVLNLDYSYAIMGEHKNQLAYEISKRLSDYSNEDIYLLLKFLDHFHP